MIPLKGFPSTVINLQVPVVEALPPPPCTRAPHTRPYRRPKTLPHLRWSRASCGGTRPRRRRRPRPPRASRASPTTTSRTRRPTCRWASPGRQTTTGRQVRSVTKPVEVEEFWFYQPNFSNNMVQYRTMRPAEVPTSR